MKRYYLEGPNGDTAYDACGVSLVEDPAGWLVRFEDVQSQAKQVTPPSSP